MTSQMGKGINYLLGTKEKFQYIHSRTLNKYLYVISAAENSDIIPYNRVIFTEQFKQLLKIKYEELVVLEYIVNTTEILLGTYYTFIIPYDNKCKDAITDYERFKHKIGVTG